MVGMRISPQVGLLMNLVCHDTLWATITLDPLAKWGKCRPGLCFSMLSVCLNGPSGGEHLPSAISLRIFMVRLFLFCCLLITSFVRADTIHVYCDDWPGFCHRDGKGVYLDVVRAIYEPWGTR